MALQTVSMPLTSRPGSAVRAAIVAYNAFLDEWRVLCVKLDADSGVVSTNYTALLDAATGVVKILDAAGRTISA